MKRRFGIKEVERKIENSSTPINTNTDFSFEEMYWSLIKEAEWNKPKFGAIENDVPNDDTNEEFDWNRPRLGMIEAEEDIEDDEFDWNRPRFSR